MNDAPHPPKLLDQLRETIRRRHMSLSTERSYVHYTTQFILLHRNQQGQFVHPRDLSANDIRTYLSHLATAKQVAASTQNGALCAILFLYRQVLHIEMPEKSTGRSVPKTSLRFSVGPKHVKFYPT